MIKSILKALVFSAVVLLVGQISVGDDTLAGHFHRQVKKAIEWGGRQVSRYPLVARLAPAERPIAREEDEEGELANDADVVTASDRESLLRLLQ